MTETLLYGVKIGNEDWQEEIITTHAERIEAASAWAKENGFDRLRVATFEDGEEPNFTNVLNLKPKPKG